ncbi:PH domain-containing protein [Ammoniphilus sp. CFH 90114]|uniref:PH domain-containing protein n=1 Tax=Ammoniphilus sp. CFH 90114 TaxID=2493665 RepID=UPI00100E47CF|nr:PH domain-containing protein [Ammoniphilus sp. CFH 90114]RXT04141.1 hypothetical protein EIZ39_21415 [Ammoniphilus sp. CFH 90114]
MAGLDEIKAQILRLEPKEGRKWVARAEVRTLPTILLNGEELVAFTLGTYQGTSGILVATNHRVIFVDKSSWTPFPYASLSSIMYKSSIEFQDGNLMGSVLMDVSNNKIILNKVPSTGAQFVRTVQQKLENYKPDTRFQTEKKTDSAAKSNKAVYLVVSSIVVLSLLFYWVFQDGMTQTTSSVPSLGITATDFSKRWNQVGKEAQSQYGISNINVVENDKNKSFTHYFTDQMKMMGILTKDGKLQKVMMMGNDEETVPRLVEQTISTVHPQLGDKQKLELVEQLGLLETDGQAKEDRQIIHTGVRYSVTHSEKIGIIFEAAAIGK